MGTVRIVAFAAILLAVAACGGETPAGPPPTYGAFVTEWSGCMITEGCGQPELEDLTEAFIATIRDLRDEYPSDVLDGQIRDAANYLDGTCPRCVSMLDRELR